MSHPFTDPELRNGYSDGSHSEIEVSIHDTWGPSEIRVRGLKMLRFMEKRWGFRFRDADRESMLFLRFPTDGEPLNGAPDAKKDVAPVTDFSITMMA